MDADRGRAPRAELLRLAAVTAAAALLLLAGAVSFARRVTTERPEAGVEWFQTSSGPLALSVARDSAADRAGLVAGDLLVAADGRPVASALDAATLAWEAGVGRIVELRVSRGGIEHTLELAAGSAAGDEPYAYLAIVGLAFLLSALVVALRWPRVRAGRVWVGLAVAMFVSLAFSHTGRADALDWGIFAADVLAAAAAPALLVHFAAAMSRRVLPAVWPLVAPAYATAGGLVVAAAWLVPGWFGGAYLGRDAVAWLEARDRVEMLFMALAIMVTAGLLGKSWARSPSAMHRSQMRWLSWGLVVGLGPFLVLYAIPWALRAPEPPPWVEFLAVVPMLLVPAAFTSALVRYRLADLDVLLVRGLSEVAAVLGAFAVLAGVVFLLRQGLGGPFTLSDSATRYVGFLAAVVSYPLLRRWVKIGMEKAFYRKRYSYRATLLDWARELNAETDLRSLLGRLRQRTIDTLGVAQARVLLRTGAWQFETHDASPAERLELDASSLERLERESCIAVGEGSLPDVQWARYLFPLRVKDRLRGALAVGERPEPGEPLSSQDRSLLGTLAAHAASAIEAARLLQEVRQRADEIEQLHAQQARILESSAIGLLLLDDERRILAWNRALEEIYGLERAQALGRRLSDVFPLHVVRRIERAASEGPREPSRLFRLPMVDRGGRRRIVNVAISPADGGEESRGGSRVVTFDDVTDRVELEQQLLQQERLASLGLLAAGVAHEINTPLTGISGFTQLLLEECAEPERREVLEKIEAQTRRVSNIAGSLLNLARPERTQFEGLDLNHTVAETLELFEPQLRRQRIHVERRLADGLPAVRGHRGKLQQVLLNLLLNARDAVSDEGEITVATFADNGQVGFEVKDDGVGIAEDDLSRIFDPFFTTKGRGNGTGLGLAVSYGIVREHRGRIEVQSRPGSGTTFRVELPAEGAARAMA